MLQALRQAGSTSAKRRPACAARACAAVRRGRRRGAARASGCRSGSRRPAACVGEPRPCATSTSSPPRPTPAALIEHFVGAALGRRGGRRAGERRRRSSRTTACGSTSVCVPPECFGNLLQHFTGSKEHNVALREDAVRRGLSVSEYGVETVETGEVATMATEEELYAYLGYAWIPPELRENARRARGGAGTGACPALVERADVLGDLHTHTDWSDGKATLEEMVAAAARPRPRYLAMCDHAKRLRDGRIERQAEEIAELGESLPGASGSSPASRSTFAPTARSISRTRGCSRSETGSSHPFTPGSGLARDVTRRILAAIEHPHVDCIGHLTGRKIGRRLGVRRRPRADLRPAVETGTFLEINGQPDRLDLRDAHARAAAEAGVRIVLSSDAHSTGALGLPRAGGRAGAPRLAHRRPGREHRALGATSEAMRKPVRRLPDGRCGGARVGGQLPRARRRAPGARARSAGRHPRRRSPHLRPTRASRSRPCSATSTR